MQKGKKLVEKSLHGLQNFRGPVGGDRDEKDQDAHQQAVLRWLRRLGAG